MYCGLAVALVFLITHCIVGFIPVGDGAGWDGSVYVQYIELLGQGKPIFGDPYRSIRMSGFLPLVIASHLGASKVLLIWLQAAINAVMLSIGAALLHDVMLRLNVKQSVATLSIAILACSWMFLCMPMFYPILSDHVALAMACVCLWCWVRSYHWTIYLLCAICAWIMPGLFLVPLVLAALPYRIKENNDTALITPNNFKPSIVLLVLLAVPLTILLLQTIYHVPLSAVSAHSASGSGKTASVDMILLSASAMLISLYLIIWIAVRLGLDPATWKSLSWSGLLVGSLFFVASATLMKISFDWNTGFAGPPLLDFLLYQSLAAPFKPLVAHFISFGPVILLAIAACLEWTVGNRRPIPVALLVVFLAFLPLLSFGSESRQWIGVLPIALVIFAVADYAWRTRVWCLVVSALVLAPAFWLKPNISIATSTGLGFQTFQWQFYFGRQGPWMSLTTYQVGLITLLAFVSIAILMRMYKNHYSSAAPLAVNNIK